MDIIDNYKFWLIVTITSAIGGIPYKLLRRYERLFSDDIINNLRQKKFDQDYAKLYYTKKIEQINRYTRSIAKFKKILKSDNNYEPQNFADKKLKDFVDNFRQTKTKINLPQNLNLYNLQNFECIYFYYNI